MKAYCATPVIALLLTGCAVGSGLDGYELVPAPSSTNSGESGSSSAGTGLGGSDPTAASSTGSGQAASGGDAAGGTGGTGPCDVGQVEHPSTHHCYAYENNAVRWIQANNMCENAGTGWTLAAVTSSEERDWLETNGILVEDQFWVGGNVQGTADTIAWTTGEPFDDPEISWLIGDGGSDECLFLDTSSDALVFADCSSGQAQHDYLCELTPPGP